MWKIIFQPQTRCVCTSTADPLDGIHIWWFTKQEPLGNQENSNSNSHQSLIVGNAGPITITTAYSSQQPHNAAWYYDKSRPPRRLLCHAGSHLLLQIKQRDHCRKRQSLDLPQFKVHILLQQKTSQYKKAVSFAVLFNALWRNHC